MRRHALLALLCLALATATPAAIKTGRYTISTGPGNYFTVHKGELTLEGGSDVSEEKSAPDRWLIHGGQIRSTVGGYLSYDPADKEGKVFLSAKPVKGAEWVFRPLKRTKGDYEERATIQAGSGPMKGWYVDVDMVESEKNGKRVVTCHFVLRKEPKRDVEVRALYTHR